MAAGGASPATSGLNILWTVDGEGRHTASWEVPRDAPLGLYRMRISAKRYRLTSRGFRVRESVALALRQVPAEPGRLAVTLDYPPAVRTST